MKKLKFFITAGKAAFVILISDITGAPAFSAVPQHTLSRGRVVRTIDSQWRFIRQDVKNGMDPGLDDKTWQVVSLPHTWNRKDAFDDIRGYYRGPAWYRKKIIVDKNLSGKQIFLKFGAANQTAEVYINGRLVTKHDGGYTAFTANITPYVKFGEENIIAVRVDNSYNRDIPPLSADFTFFGGIYRDVWMIVTNPVHIAVTHLASPGVLIQAKNVSDRSAVVVVKTLTVNNSDDRADVGVETLIADQKGHVIEKMNSNVTIAPGQSQEIVQSSPVINNPHLWSATADPYLYSVTTNVIENGNVIDSETNPLGIRWLMFDPDKGFFLNGKHLKLHGVDRHQFYPGMGSAVPARYHVADMRMIKDMGGNFVRLAHYPQDPSVLDAADRLGILIWQEIPVVNTIDTSAAFTRNASHMLREMIHQYYNHPSIILWGYMNEILLVPPYRNDQPVKRQRYFQKVVELAKHLNDIAHQEDPTRETAMAMHHSSLYDQTGLSSVPDVVGWNLYQGWYEPMTNKSGENLFGKFLDEQHAKYPKRVIIVSEYGAGSDSRIHTANPQRFDFSVEYQNYYHEQILNQINQRPFVSGSTAWVMFDFPSEGRNDTRPWINEKGLVNEDRTPKEVYYFYKAKFSDKPVLHIASRDWTYRTVPYEERSRKLFSEPVAIFSNLQSVTMTDNGRSIGTRHPVQSGYINWTVPMSIGANNLIVQSRKNGRIYSDELTINVTYRGDFSGKSGDDPLLLVDAGAHYQFYPEPGVVWEADQSDEGHDWGFEGGEPGHTPANILGTSDDPVYQNYREGVKAYHFDVPPGSYEVKIYLCEPDYAVPGKRVFSTSVNGNDLFSDLDLAETYGKDVPVSRAIQIDTDGGNGITISFTASQGKTLINGISIRRR